jgi:NTE family protein
MRASMAVPGAFSPVVEGDRVLSDGGLVRNLPVDVARELCADVVIAVWLSSPQPAAGDLVNAVALAGRFLDVVIEANERIQIESLTDSDVGIDVPMGDISSADFQRTPEAIDLGRSAAEAMAEKLQRLSLPEDEYQAWRESIEAPLDAGTVVAEVRIVGLDRVSEAYVRQQMRNVRVGEKVTAEQIKADTGAIYELGDFERVEYRLSGPASSRSLEIVPVEKSWGPDFLRFDLGLDAAGNGELQAILRAEHTRAWINGRGGRWNNTLQFGQQTILQTDLYQPLNVDQRFFVQPKVAYESDLENVYVDGNRSSRYFLRDFYAQLDLGWNIRSEAQLRAGVRGGWVESKLDTGTSLLPDLDREDENAFVTGMVYDTRDNASLATSGTFMNVRYWKAGDVFGGDVEYSLAEAVATRTWQFRGNTLNLLMGGGAEITGKLPPTRDFRLGGIRSFPGLQPGELRGGSYWLVSGNYRWKIADILPLFGQSLYAGMRLQAAQMGDRRDAIEDGTLYGVAGSMNARTPVGALSLSLGWVSNDSVQLQFSLGRPIAEGSLVDETF